MPESRTRKKRSYTPPPVAKDKRPSPRWWAPLMLTLMVLGLVWVVTYYITSTKYPIPGIEDVNLLLGFALIMVGFGMTTRWR